MASNKMRTPVCAGLVLCSALVAAAALAQDVSFVARLEFPVGADPRSVAVGDFNGDRVLDLAVANLGSASVLLGNGDGSFQAPRSFAVGDNPFSVAVGDFNRDGLPDLAVANLGSNNVSVLINNTRLGDLSFQPARNFLLDTGPGGPSFVAVGDFNADGLPDLAAANPNSDRVVVLINNTRP